MTAVSLVRSTYGGLESVEEVSNAGMAHAVEGVDIQ